MNYLDTSALIKRFVTEKWSPLVESLVGQEGFVATAKIAYAEVHAGLTRKHREGHLSGSQYALACRQFENDWQAYIPQPQGRPGRTDHICCGRRTSTPDCQGRAPSAARRRNKITLTSG